MSAAARPAIGAGTEYSSVMPHRFGLCDACAHQRLVRTGRGSVFSLCERSRIDPGFPKYPRMPVLECRGFEERSARAD